MNTNDFSLSRGARAARVVLLTLAAASTLPACAPMVVGGAMLGGALASVDRRTAGTQVEDQSIELKAVARVREVTNDQAHVNATSYNRIVLLTGEVPDAATRGAVEQAMGRIEGVRSVVNELAVMGKTTITARSNDAVLSARVKAGFIDAKDLQANTVKVTTERGVVYLMGRVTEREARRAVEVARTTSADVKKVVKIFEILSEEELANLKKQ
jgi:osmotically-inducible protein OsmY